MGPGARLSLAGCAALAMLALALPGCGGGATAAPDRADARQASGATPAPDQADARQAGEGAPAEKGAGQKGAGQKGAGTAASDGAPGTSASADGTAASDGAPGASASASQTTASGGARADGCPAQLGRFVDSLESLRRRLVAGLTYGEYADAVRALRARYATIPIARLTPACLLATGTPSERAFNLYAEAANAWGECLSQPGCDAADVEAPLQAEWHLASRQLEALRRR